MRQGGARDYLTSIQGFIKRIVHAEAAMPLGLAEPQTAGW